MPDVGADQELQSSLSVAEGQLKSRSKGVQTIRRPVGPSSMSVEERGMTDRLAAVLGKAEVRGGRQVAVAVDGLESNTNRLKQTIANGMLTIL